MKTAHFGAIPRVIARFSVYYFTWGYITHHCVYICIAWGYAMRCLVTIYRRSGVFISTVLIVWTLSFYCLSGVMLKGMNKAIEEIITVEEARTA